MRILFWFGRNRETISGTSAKIYKIERRGRTVTASWGPAVWDLQQRRAKQRGKLQTKQWPFDSIEKAEDFLRKKLAQKKASGYEQNPRRRAASV